jgi:hypothetical protein
MTLREREVQPRRRGRSTTPQTLAIDIVRDDPNAPRGRQKARWKAQVREDEDLLEVVLDGVCDHVFVLADNYLARRQSRGATRSRTTEQQQQSELRAIRFAQQLRTKLFECTAENGKKIGRLTDKELEQLEQQNTTRANLYHQLRKRMRGRKTVRECWDVDAFSKIAGKLAPVTELKKLFGTRR